MSLSSLYRLFGIGKRSARWRTEFEAEGIVLAEEGMRGSITFENYRCPMFVCGWNKRAVAGSLILTRARLAMFTLCQKYVEIPVSTQNLAKIQCSLENENRIRIFFRAQDFLPNHTGNVTLCLRTPAARQILERLKGEGFTVSS